MKLAPTIARREISSYFYSPMAYVAMALFLLVAGFFFQRDFEPGQPAGMRTVFEWMVWAMLVIVPLLSMGLLSQEWASGTMETMMTAPISETDLVVGKWLGGFGFFALLLSPTLCYVVLLKAYSGIHLGPIFAGYLGLLLVGSLFFAVGLLCSSLTRSQVVAAVAAIAALALITLVPYLLQLRGSELNERVRRATDLLVHTRYFDFTKGIVDTGHVVFFLAFTGVALFLTVKVLESRRWK